jgi:anthranilate phosphoribosyltransferase
VAELASDGSIRSYTISPADFGLPEADPAGLKGGDAAFNARILREALAGAPGPVRLTALMTAAAGLYVAGLAGDLKSGAERATEALDSGAALRVLERVRAMAPLPSAV